MKATTALLRVLVLAGVVAQTSCLTNGEFYTFVKQYADEFHEEEIDSAMNDTDEDTISLPGGPNDEIDMVALIAKLGLNSPSDDQDDEEEEETGLSWWWHHHHHHHYHHHYRPGRWCHCHRHGCTCCVRHKFRINMLFHHIRFHIRACVSIVYIPHYHGLRLTFTLNHRVLYSRSFSLRYPWHNICYRVPGLSRFAHVCLQLYNINFYRKHFKRYRIHLNIGCFRVPFGEDDLNKMLGESKNWAFQELSAADDDGLKTAEAIDLMSDAPSFINADEFSKIKNSDQE